VPSPPVSGGGGGDAGNISIDPVFVILKQGKIQANAFGGIGGNIQITAQHLLQDPLSIIEASSQLGIDGKIAIDAPQIDLSGSTHTRTQNFLGKVTLDEAACQPGLSLSRFKVYRFRADPVPDGQLPLRAAYPQNSINKKDDEIALSPTVCKLTTPAFSLD